MTQNTNKDELTEEEYLASCLSKLKKNRNLRHGLAQEAQNTVPTIKAVPQIIVVPPFQETKWAEIRV